MMMTMIVYIMLMVVKIILMMTMLRMMVTATTFPMERSVPGNGHKDCTD